MSVLSVLIKDLVERTTLADNTCFIAGTVDANKITFSNLVAAIKGKLGAAAQKSVANNLTTAAAGTSVLDAYQGKLLSDKIDSLNSTLNNLKWTDWVNLGSALGVSIKYRYNAYEVELLYSGTFEKKVINGGSAGYVFPALPDGLNPRYNVDHSIYACAGNNAGAITLQCYPTGTPNAFKITSHKTITVEPEYVCGRFRYTRN